MKSTLYVPKTLKVGYQNRKDTYTGQLAYVIYYDSKGKLRKETSWENWRSKDIEPNEYDNVPTEGFVLNKKVGDYCDYEHRQAYTRVYDPRGFEVEISIDNLLYILENTSCIKGKGLEGEFVYAWDGKDLVLLPISSPDYKDIMAYNEKVQSNKKFNTKNLIVGATYLTKGDSEIVYIGKFPVYDTIYEIDGKTFTSYRKMLNYCEKNNIEYEKRVEDEGVHCWHYRSYHQEPIYKEKIGVVGKEHWFGWKQGDKYEVTHHKSADFVIDVVDETCSPEYANIFDKMETNIGYSPYDESRDEYIPYDVETLTAEASCYGCWGFYLKDNNGIRYNEHFYSHGGKIKINSYYSDTGHEESMTLEEFIEKHHPHYIKVYLQNGKLYYKGRVKPYDCK